MSTAIILLSGGLDSATVLAIAQYEGFDCLALSFRYGQTHVAEVRAAERIAEKSEVKRHVVVDIDLRVFGGSALTSDIAIPKNRDSDEMSAGIPITYVPARNTIFLSYALAFAEVTGASKIYIGVNAVDYSGYPDCRPEFVTAFEAVANLATKAAVEDGQSLSIVAPLMHLTKGEIVKLGTGLGVDYRQTVSCYDADDDGRACGSCDSCVLRRRGFEDAGLADPTLYVAGE
jgi:7-cyano-7-deazaguanine synthase